MRITVVGFGAAAWLALAVACGGDDGGDPPPPLMGADAVAACEAIVDKLCELTMRCGGTLSADECRADASTSGLLCDRAVAVAADYSDCFGQIDRVSCSAMEAPDECRSIVQLGPERPVPAALTGCFVPTVDNCDEHCASLGKSCEDTCAIWPGLPADFAGIGWQDADVCPDSEEGLAVPSCDTPISIDAQARCCCSL